jgi:hypothetical protein
VEERMSKEQGDWKFFIKPNVAWQQIYKKEWITPTFKSDSILPGSQIPCPKRIMPVKNPVTEFKSYFNLPFFIFCVNMRILSIFFFACFPNNSEVLIAESAAFHPHISCLSVKPDSQNSIILFKK